MNNTDNQQYISAQLCDYTIPLSEIEYTIINDSDLQSLHSSQPQSTQNTHESLYESHFILTKMNDIEHHIRDLKRVIPHLNGVKTIQDTIDVSFKASILSIIVSFIALLILLLYILN